MNMIEQVKELRGLSETFEGKRLGRILEQAADTIESISAKLQVANMEALADRGGWITDRVPTKEECRGSYETFAVTVNANGLKTMAMDFVYEEVRGREVCRWKWHDRLSPWEVIAWYHFPEPYNGGAK